LSKASADGSRRQLLAQVIDLKPIKAFDNEVHIYAPPIGGGEHSISVAH
jgi:hypothetical protein